MRSVDERLSSESSGRGENLHSQRAYADMSRPITQTPQYPGPQMHCAEVVRIALRVLVRHPLRSVLTMLGISIGVGAFICSGAVGEGASNQIQEQIRSLGENMIWIEAGGRNVNGVRTGTHGTSSLTLED